jgi:hypothetical protein
MKMSIKIFALIALFNAQTHAAESSLARCELPADQGYGSLMGSWESLPVSLIVDREFYAREGGQAAEALLRAVRTWNDWAGRRGKTAFVVSAEADIPRVTECNQSAYTKGIPAAAGIWIIDGSPGRENRRHGCGGEEKILPGEASQTDWLIEGGRILGASVLLNFEDFNSPGKPSIDLETLLAHELGHVLGLLHSCNGRGPLGTDGTSAPFCRQAPVAYRKAVMAPIYPGDVRRELGANDLNRLKCLY